MQEIRYSRGKLWLLAICSAHITVLMAALFVRPQNRVPGRFGFVINGSFGHFFTLPLVGLLCFVVAVRCVIIASGSAVAIVTDPGGATITTMWRSHRVAWNDLLRIRLAATKVRGANVFSLKFDRCAGGTISLPLAGLILPVHGHYYQRLADALSEAHLLAINDPLAGASKATVRAEDDFVRSTSQPTPGRPVFGRKIG